MEFSKFCNAEGDGGGEGGGSGGEGGEGAGGGSEGGQAGAGAAGGGDGGGTALWTDGLSDGIKELDPEFKIFGKYDSNDAALKGLINAQRMIGKPSIPIPSDETGWEEVFSKLGRPDTSDGYELNVPNGYEANSSMQKEFRAEMHKLGFSDKQAAGMNDWYWKQVADQAQADATNSEEAADLTKSTLQAKWGSGYSSNLNVANRAVNELFSKEVAEKLESSGLVNDAVFMQDMAKLGLANLEDIVMVGKGESGVISIDSVGDKIKEIMNDPDYLNEKSHRYRGLIDKVMSLRRQKIKLEQAV